MVALAKWFLLRAFWGDIATGGCGGCKALECADVGACSLVAFGALASGLQISWSHQKGMLACKSCRGVVDMVRPKAPNVYILASSWGFNVAKT